MAGTEALLIVLLVHLEIEKQYSFRLTDHDPIHVTRLSAIHSITNAVCYC